MHGAGLSDGVSVSGGVVVSDLAVVCCMYSDQLILTNVKRET